jgi:hypothetical protein
MLREYYGSIAVSWNLALGETIYMATIGQQILKATPSG